MHFSLPASYIAVHFPESCNPNTNVGWGINLHAWTASPGTAILTGAAMVETVSRRDESIMHLNYYVSKTLTSFLRCRVSELCVCVCSTCVCVPGYRVRILQVVLCACGLFIRKNNVYVWVARWSCVNGCVQRDGSLHSTLGGEPLVACSVYKDADGQVYLDVFVATLSVLRAPHGLKLSISLRRDEHRNSVSLITSTSTSARHPATLFLLLPIVCSPHWEHITSKWWITPRYRTTTPSANSSCICLLDLLLSFCVV